MARWRCGAGRGRLRRRGIKDEEITRGIRRLLSTAAEEVEVFLNVCCLPNRDRPNRSDKSSSAVGGRAPGGIAGLTLRARKNTQDETREGNWLG